MVVCVEMAKLIEMPFRLWATDHVLGGARISLRSWQFSSEMSQPCIRLDFSVLKVI